MKTKIIHYSACLCGLVIGVGVVWLSLSTVFHGPTGETVVFGLLIFFFSFAWTILGPE